jgi:hypothetical protein
MNKMSGMILDLADIYDLFGEGFTQSIMRERLLMLENGAQKLPRGFEVDLCKVQSGLQELISMNLTK